MAIIKMDNRIYGYECPECGCKDLEVGQSYCQECGEPIEWKDDEE